MLPEDDIRTQVLDLASRGRSVRDIAQQLHLSKSRVGRIKRQWDGGRGTAVGHQH
jgi:transposase